MVLRLFYLRILKSTIMNITNIRKAARIIGKICLATLKLAVIGIVAAAVIAGIVLIQEKHDHYTCRTLSEDVSVHYYYNTGRYSIFNEADSRYTAKKLEWVTDVNPKDTFSVFSRKDKRGYINTLNGRIIIPEQYEKAWIFSEGVAAVMKDGKIGFINSRNQTVLPFDFEFAPGISYVFRNGYCAMTDANKACGLIGMDGEWVLEPQYDCIWTPDANGMRLVSDNGRFGLLGKDLILAYPIEYDYIMTLDDGNILMVKNGIKRKVAPDGTVIEDFVIDGTWEMSYPSGLEMYVDEDYRGNTKHQEKVIHTLSDYRGYRIDLGDDSLCGVFHAKTGEVVIPALYDHVRMVSENVFLAEDRYNGTSTLIEVR